MTGMDVLNAVIILVLVIILAVKIRKAWRSTHNAPSKPAMPAGYVVVSTDDRYLDRHLVFRKHPSIAEGYVHDLFTLLRISSYIHERAAFVFHAQYNPETECTEVLDPKPIPWVVFLDQERRKALRSL